MATLKNVIAKALVLFTLFVLAILFIGTCINRLSAATVDMLEDTANAMISTKPVGTHINQYGGLSENVPKGLTQVAGYVGETPLYQGTLAILMITVNVSNIKDMHIFLIKNNLDIKGEKKHFRPRFNK
jgi:hypothetical protein